MRDSSDRRGSVRAPEVLLVAGLLAVLLLAAAPTWRARQVSRDVTLAKMRMQAIAPALLAYHTDFAILPPYNFAPDVTGVLLTASHLLTTPVAYLPDASALVDPFANPGWPAGHPGGRLIFLDYHNPLTDSAFFIGSIGYQITLPNDPNGWRLESMGPDLATGPYIPQRGGAASIVVHYDPTNGVVSDGQIVHDHAAPYTMGPSWLMR